jgi:hypothetical protein
MFFKGFSRKNKTVASLSAVFTVHQVKQATSGCCRKGEDEDFFQNHGEVKGLRQEMIDEKSEKRG